MSECKKCGRDDGHYIGCPEILRVHTPAEVAEDLSVDDPKVRRCAYDDCPNPKRPKSKGPAPKYCTEHSDPKNRK